MKKKVTALSHQRGCEDLRAWIKSICNHLYWCALSSNGDAALAVAKWSSLAAHVQNLHIHDDDLFPACTHPPIDSTAGQKKWLKPSMLFFYLTIYLKMLDISGYAFVIRRNICP